MDNTFLAAKISTIEGELTYRNALINDQIEELQKGQRKNIADAFTEMHSLLESCILGKWLKKEYKSATTFAKPRLLRPLKSVGSFVEIEGESVKIDSSGVSYCKNDYVCFESFEIFAKFISDHIVTQDEIWNYVYRTLLKYSSYAKHSIKQWRHNLEKGYIDYFAYSRDIHCVYVYHNNGDDMITNAQVVSATFLGAESETAKIYAKDCLQSIKSVSMLLETIIYSDDNAKEEDNH